MRVGSRWVDAICLSLRWHGVHVDPMGMAIAHHDAHAWHIGATIHGKNLNILYHWVAGAQESCDIALTDS